MDRIARVMSSSVAVWIVLASGLAATSHALAADRSAPVPPLVRGFIAQNCAIAHSDFRAFQNCVAGEMAGYRATVDILTATDDPDGATARYRSCAAGPRGVFLHRFHRQRAACMGAPLGALPGGWRAQPA